MEMKTGIWFGFYFFSYFERFLRDFYWWHQTFEQISSQEFNLYVAELYGSRGNLIIRALNLQACLLPKSVGQSGMDHSKLKQSMQRKSRMCLLTAGLVVCCCSDLRYS